MDQPESQAPLSPKPERKRFPKKKRDESEEVEKSVKNTPLHVKKVEEPPLKRQKYESCYKRCREDIKKIEYIKNEDLKVIPFGRLKEAYLQMYCANDQLQHDMKNVKGKKAKSLMKAFEDANYKLNNLVQKSLTYCQL